MWASASWIGAVEKKKQSSRSSPRTFIIFFWPSCLVLSKVRYGKGHGLSWTDLMTINREAVPKTWHGSAAPSCQHCQQKSILQPGSQPGPGLEWLASMLRQFLSVHQSPNHLKAGSESPGCPQQFCDMPDLGCSHLHTCSSPNVWPTHRAPSSETPAQAPPHSADYGSVETPNDDATCCSGQGLASLSSQREL